MPRRRTHPLTHRWSPPPASLRRATLDNLALVPGSLLATKARWQQVANRLPDNAILIVLPTNHPVQKHTLLTVAKQLATEGHQVRVVSAGDFATGDEGDPGYLR